mgnify:CR=1 FL=1
MKTSIIRMFLIPFNLLVLICCANAQDRILIAENAPPNSFVENDRLTGRTVEIVQAVLKEIGMESHNTWLLKDSTYSLLPRTSKILINCFGEELTLSPVLQQD